MCPAWRRSIATAGSASSLSAGGRSRAACDGALVLICRTARKRARTLAAVLFLGLAACASKPILSGPPLRAFLYDIQVGTPREELIRQLGEPAERITVDETEFLFYYTDWINTSKAIERSPFAIEDGRVVSMGKTYYYAYLKAHGRFKGDA